MKANCCWGMRVGGGCWGGEVEHFSRFSRMWRAMFKRECVYLLFQATSITRRLFPSLLPPSQPSAPMSHGGPSLEAQPLQGDGHGPHFSHLASCSGVKANTIRKKSNNVSYNCSETDVIEVVVGPCVYSVGNTGPFFWRKTAVTQLRTTGFLEEDLSPSCYHDGGSRVVPGPPQW